MTDTASAPGEIVSLTVPARGPYARLVRIGAAALAGRNGFLLSDVDDLRLAVDEAMILLLAAADRTGSSADTEVHVDYQIVDDTLVLDARVTAGRGTLDEATCERFRFLAGNLVDTYRIDPVAAQVHLEKRRR